MIQEQADTTEPQSCGLRETIGSPAALLENGQTFSDAKDNKETDQIQIDTEMQFFSEIQCEKKQIPKKTFSQKLYLFSLIGFISLSFCLSGQQQGIYNTMVKHLPYIYGWKENEDDQEGEDRTNIYLGLINSMVSIGAVIVQIGMFYFQNIFGRRTFMRIASCFTICGSSLGLIKSTPFLLFGRVLNGCSIGIVTTITAIYIVEYIPPQYKSELTLLTLIFFRLGLVMQFGLGYGLPDNNEDRESSYWRLMVAFPIIFAALHLSILTFILKYDTPTFVYMNTKGNETKTLKVFSQLYPEEQAQNELKTLINLTPGNKEQKEKQITLKVLWKDYKIQLLIGCLMAFSFHFGLAYPILMFSNKILQEHHSKSTATFITTITPMMDFFSLIPAMFLVKKLGIKKLFLISVIGTIISTVGFSILGYVQLYSIQKFMIWVIRLCFSFGIPTGLFRYASEILPFIGNTIMISIMYIIGFCVIQFYLPLSNALGGHEGAFIFFASGLFILLIIFGPFGLMIETKGLMKTQVNEKLKNFRWFNKYEKHVE